MLGYILTGIVLFFLGILCFLYAFGKLNFPDIFAGKKRRRKQPSVKIPEKTSAPPKKPPVTIARPPEAKKEADLFNRKYPESKKNSDFEERIIQERVISKKFAPDPVILEGNSEQKNTKSAENEIKSPGRSLKQRTGIVILPGADNPPEVLSDNEQLSLEGILFIDYGKKIPFNNRKLKEIQWNEDFFTSFKRVGNAKMSVNAKVFIFFHGEEAFRYPVDDLEQVIFYDHAFSFIPVNQSLPIPVFFSEQTQKLKDYLANQYS